MENEMSAEIMSNSFRRCFEEDGATLLEIDISIPRVSGIPAKSCEKINRFYEDIKKHQLKYAQESLLKRARKSRAQVLIGQIECVPYRLEVRFQTIHNSGDRLTICWDMVESVPGEESAAVRHVDVWSPQSGMPVFLIMTRRHRRALVRALEMQAEKRAGMGGNYYGRLRRNVGKHFREGNCSPTERGIRVYYPLYSLAPSGEGFPEFEVEGKFRFE